MFRQTNFHLTCTLALERAKYPGWLWRDSQNT